MGVGNYKVPSSITICHVMEPVGRVAIETKLVIITKTSMKMVI